MARLRPAGNQLNALRSFAAALLPLLAACSSQQEPAQRLMHDVESTFAATSADGGKFAPEQTAAVQTRVAALRLAYQQQDYDAVVTQGPEVLVQTQNLATSVTAGREATLSTLNTQWSELAAYVPDEVAALRERIAAMDKPASTKRERGRAWEGIDPDAAKTSLSEAQSLWSKAHAAFATGNLPEAVKTASEVKTRLEAVAVQVNLELPPDAQTPPR